MREKKGKKKYFNRVFSFGGIECKKKINEFNIRLPLCPSTINPRLERSPLLHLHPLLQHVVCKIPDYPLDPQRQVFEDKVELKLYKEKTFEIKLVGM